MKAEPVIAILGTVDDARTLEVKSVTRLQALATTRGAGPTPYVAQLLGAQGEVLATAPVVRLPAHGSGCGCGTSDPAAGPFVFEAMVPDVAPEPGEHRCTLVVRGRGGTSRVEAALRTLDPRETNPRRLAGTDTATGTTARRARARRRSGAGGRRRKGGRSR